mmetsp:Transcript_6930/g.17329  ORF Transcript_6930/g.17329 Transcript_6930/m.17329 type:complete len:232 (-) Transcript_6930:947-1642(-)
MRFRFMCSMWGRLLLLRHLRRMRPMQLRVLRPTRSHLKWAATCHQRQCRVILCLGAILHARKRLHPQLAGSRRPHDAEGCRSEGTSIGGPDTSRLIADQIIGRICWRQRPIAAKRTPDLSLEGAKRRSFHVQVEIHRGAVLEDLDARVRDHDGELPFRRPAENDISERDLRNDKVRVLWLCDGVDVDGQIRVVQADVDLVGQPNAIQNQTCHVGRLLHLLDLRVHPEIRCL